jgi:hypothetical protein
MLGVWIAPVTAQVMITLFVVISKPSRLRPYPLAAGPPQALPELV